MRALQWCYPATKVSSGGAGATVETVKAKVGNNRNSHEVHGDLVADAAAPGA
jgi:hypothetical protein